MIKILVTLTTIGFLTILSANEPKYNPNPATELQACNSQMAMINTNLKSINNSNDVRRKEMQKVFWTIKRITLLKEHCMQYYDEEGRFWLYSTDARMRNIAQGVSDNTINIKWTFKKSTTKKPLPLFPPNWEETKARMEKETQEAEIDRIVKNAQAAAAKGVIIDPDGVDPSTGIDDDGLTEEERKSLAIDIASGYVNEMDGQD